MNTTTSHLDDLGNPEPKTPEQQILETQIKGMSTDDLLVYRKHQQETVGKLKSAGAIDSLIFAAEPFDKFGEDKKPSKNLGIVSDKWGYASRAVVPAVVGLLTSTVLKQRGSTNRIAKSIGAAAATAGFELVLGVNDCVTAINSVEDYNTRKSIGFIDNELARRNAGQVNERQ